MSYKRKANNRNRVTKFFSDEEYQAVSKTCGRYGEMMKDAGLRKIDVQFSATCRMDVTAEVPSVIAHSVRDDLEIELGHWMPGQTRLGDVRSVEIGNGMSRVQVPVFPV